MTRDATSGTLTASQSAAPRPILFVQLDLPTGVLRVNSTDRSLFFESDGASPLNEFFGVGDLGSVSTVGETFRLQATGVTLSLSGITSTYISSAFEQAMGRSGKIWLGFFDDNYAVISEPASVFSGKIDNATIAIGDTATVTMQVENRMIAWERPRIRRYSNEDQQQRFAGESPTITDKFFEFITQSVDKEIIWGVASP